VCRIQRVSNNGGKVGSEGSGTNSRPLSHDGAVANEGIAKDSSENDKQLSGPSVQSAGPSDPPANSEVRFFIMKSLAVEELLWSVRDGYWVTQLHNEMALNEAFKVLVSRTPDHYIDPHLTKCSAVGTYTSYSLPTDPVNTLVMHA